jgi:hypothetical protein
LFRAEVGAKLQHNQGLPASAQNVDTAASSGIAHQMNATLYECFLRSEAAQATTSKVGFSVSMLLT